MREVVIVDAVRTPIGRYSGALKDVRPDDLGAVVIKALMERNPDLPPSEIGDVILGTPTEQVKTIETWRVCHSSWQDSLKPSAGQPSTGCVVLDWMPSAWQPDQSCANEEDVIIAGGTESMTRAPFVMSKPERDFPRGNMELFDTTIGWRFINPKMQELYGTDSMPQTAENVAKDMEFHEKNRTNSRISASRRRRPRWNPGGLQKRSLQLSSRTEKAEKRL